MGNTNHLSGDESTNMNMNMNMGLTSTKTKKGRPPALNIPNNNDKQSTQLTAPLNDMQLNHNGNMNICSAPINGSFQQNMASNNNNNNHHNLPQSARPSHPQSQQTPFNVFGDVPRTTHQHQHQQHDNNKSHGNTPNNQKFNID